MRLMKLTTGDIRIQWKCGFYIVYAIFTAVYLLTLAAVPESIQQTVATVMIFTDPAAMGLFFMGALILLEKSQHINLAIAVSPVRVWEYCAAKLISLSLIAVIVALPLALMGGVHISLSFIAGLLLSSFLFSACGLIVAEKAETLNQFVLLAVPFELFICLPPALLLFSIEHPAMILHPGVAAVRLIYGNADSLLLSLLCLAAWCVIVFFICFRTVGRSFRRTGGAKV